MGGGGGAGVIRLCGRKRGGAKRCKDKKKEKRTKTNRSRKKGISKRLTLYISTTRLKGGGKRKNFAHQETKAGQATDSLTNYEGESCKTK